ncbi:radical SAM family heme chaperone HemW [Myroides sp. LJL119]
MAGIYIHIPFCKQACHYCDFHFSTSVKNAKGMLQALKKEITMRSNELGNDKLETIYFGGGTPSILEVGQINDLIQHVYQTFSVGDQVEITLEANPDDLDLQTIEKLAKSKVNRLSIGIQSFDQADLKMMNRAHNAQEALSCLKNAVQYFDNISIDLIYGIPNMSNQRWLENILTVINLGIKHISCYALTVEQRTALHKLIEKGEIPNVREEEAHEHFQILVQTLKQNGYIHYELSNFSKPGFYSKNNSGYWLGRKYIGIGPSAHSFNGVQRSWNISNNNLYIKSIENNELPSEKELLSISNRYNEYIMTGLRTIWGVDLLYIEENFGELYKDYFLKSSDKYLKNDMIANEQNRFVITHKGKFLSDGIASDLFWID